MNPATPWARALVSELVRSGVTDVCMAPGSRSTPLVLAAARQDGLRLRVFLDERSAGFFALGLGRASGRPAAVLTTSGTAVANLLPAVVEASQAEVPLIVLSADRPARLRDADANQTISQATLFGDFVRWRAELERPRADDDALRHLRVQACRAVAEALGLPAGPVHLDVPFEKPLEPTPGDVPGAGEALEAPDGGRGGWRGRGDGPAAPPYSRISMRRPRLGEGEVEALARRLAATSRGVIVAGPHPEAERLGPVARALARATGFLLLADPLSGARWPAPDDGVWTCVAHDAWLDSEVLAGALHPDLILRVGAAPTSASLLRWLSARHDVPQVVLDAGHRYKDHLAVAHEVLRGCPVDALDRVAARLRSAAEEPRAGSDAWARGWARVDAAAAGVLAPETAPPAAPLHEGRIARALVEALDPGVPLFVSSSMPVRDVDGFGGPRSRPLQVVGNRGASGIDGIVSTALGVAAGRGAPVVALVGDLAFLHDVNGLLATREPDAAVVFVVVNNDGGGIFHTLPVAAHEPAFTPYFATPHGVDPARAAALYGVAHHRAATPDEVVNRVRACLASGDGAVVEIRTDREENHRERTRVRAAARRAAEAAAPPSTSAGPDPAPSDDG